VQVPLCDGNSGGRLQLLVSFRYDPSVGLTALTAALTGDLETYGVIRGSTTDVMVNKGAVNPHGPRLQRNRTMGRGRWDEGRAMRQGGAKGSRPRPHRVSGSSGAGRSCARGCQIEEESAAFVRKPG